ncbi:MAG: SprT-like domain-containing protein [Paludibacteraceae bacterium]|nr:SprT-like domain-containing protein [Paludibacteraceae bacterium]
MEYIQAHFDEYNRQYFGGALPTLPIKLSHARGFLGKVTFVKRRSWLFGPYKNENFVLRINVKIDLPEEVVQDTILHEMIHYYIAVNQWKDTSAHGKLFRAEMARINKEGNRHIRISYRLSSEKQNIDRVGNA